MYSTVIGRILNGVEKRRKSREGEESLVDIPCAQAVITGVVCSIVIVFADAASLDVLTHPNKRELRTDENSVTEESLKASTQED